MSPLISMNFNRAKTLVRMSARCKSPLTCSTLILSRNKFSTFKLVSSFDKPSIHLPIELLKN
ncbi:hypothetical protein HanRHA438_Chr09g0399241 [Helianthus annuus]|nr:hypothetical protein HanRHA438_Chr09g0399241 [Helianthus annuus]